MSFAQQRLWLIDQLDGPSPLYNLPIALRLRGPLDVVALRRAAADVVARHESLRTVFPVSEGMPRQEVLPAGETRPRVDVVPCAEDEYPALRDAAAARPFDLGTEPPIRVTVFVLGPEEHVLLVVLHHIAADGWSQAPFLRDLAVAYRARRAGDRAPAWEPLPVQYADYTLWQRELLGSDGDPESLLSRQLAHWREVLAGLPEELGLPTDRPRPAALTGTAADAVPVRLAPRLHRSLVRLAREHRATSFMVLQASLAALMSRLGAGRDIAVGTPVAGRTDEALEELVGFFNNTLVLRTDVSGDPSFTELLGRAREVNLSAQAHQDVPFERLVEELNPARSLARHPLFQVMLTLQNHEPGRFDLPGVTAEPEPIGVRVAKFDLSIGIEETHGPDGVPAGMTGSLEYATELFDRATVERLTRCWVRLLESAAARPELPLSELEILSAEERREALAAGRGGPVPPHRLAPLGELFAARAACRPERTAVAGARGGWSYAELADRVDRLARRLTGQGVGAGTPVALSLGRTPAAVAALLGVVAAGGTAVPLPTELAPEHRAHLVTASGAALLLTDGADSADSVRWLPSGVRVLRLAEADAWPGGTAPPTGPTGAGAAAYLLPEAPPPEAGDGPPALRALRHRDVAGLTADHRWDDGTDGPRVLLHAPWSTDAAVFELWLPLLTGGTVVPAPEDTPDPKALPGLVADGGLTTLRMDTAHFARTVRADAAALRGLRTVIVGGAPVPAEPLRVAREACPELRLVCALDPAGGADFVTARVVTDEDLAHGGPVPLGRPLDGLRLHVLDGAGLRPVPHGVPGELCLAAAGHAHGRVHAPSATTVADPHAPEPGGRLLRTGVLVRRRVDGVLLLPDHAQPADPTRPTAPVGNTVPEDVRARPGGGGPRTPEEEVLRTLFADTLGLDPDGLTIGDDFFHLGGHSLLAIRLTSRIRAALGAELSIRTVFEHPTIAELGEKLAADRPRPAPTAVAVRPERPPLSYAQQRFWLVDQLEGAGTTHNISLPLRLRGALDVPALGAALTDVVARHEALRTVFAESDGVPWQRVLDAPGAEALLTETDRTVDEAAAHSFDLSGDRPLLHAYLHPATRPEDRPEEQAEERVLTLVVHHIAADGWSLGPLLRDLATAYRARRAGDRAPAWKPLPVQYVDYALWQRDLLGSDSDPDSPLSRQLAHWRQALDGLPEELPLPLDRPRPAAAGHRARQVPVTLDATAHLRLTELAREHGATPFMVVQAALAAVLHRFGAGDDIPIGSPVAGRTDEALDDLVGFFSNTLVLRTDLTGRPDFTELLGRVRETGLAALTHQDVPFERLVEELNPARSLARHPLFQVALSLHGTEDTPPDFDGLDVSFASSDITTSTFDLTLSLGERHTPDGSPAGLDGAFEYATDVFDRATARRLATCFTRLLTAVLADPRRPVAEIELLSPEERRTLLDGRQGTPTRRGHPGATVPEVFARQAAATPEAVAVDGARRLTYAELDARANRLAHRLRTLGVGPETPVALLLDHSPEVVTAALAVLKAGGAYVPLHPGLPAERMADILHETGAAVLLTDRADAGFEHRARVLRPDEEPPRTAGAEDAPPVRVAAGQLAYVMYTSGSTGRPKGVAVHHRDITALAADRWWADGSMRRVLLHSSYAFDAATFEMWVPLLTGGTVVCAPTAHPEPADLAALIARHHVTGLFLTKGLFDLIAQERPTALRGLHTVLTGGEAGSAASMRRVLEACPGLRLLNAYGPTETTTFATLHPIRPSEPDNGRPLPIGGPLDGTRAYVLDRELRPLPVGVAGELYLAGSGQARGYLGHPALTAERFVPDPHAPRPGTRMYRTGDLVRWNDDGALEYLGRTDQQVKLRGFRIEPGEIEAALAAHPGVAQAAVLLREENGDRRLVGYCVPADDTLTTAALRRHAAGSLPAYMVPAALVLLDRLPLTSNGKIDRGALPAPDYTTGGTGREPGTPRQRRLRELFAGVLGLAPERVHLDDDFFRLGGHSLLATRLAGRVRSAFGTGLSLRTLFEHPTIAALDALLDLPADPASPSGGAGGAGGAGEATPVEAARPRCTAGERPAVLPLSFAQRRLWLIDRLEGESPFYNIPLVLRLDGPLDRAALRAAVGDLMVRHESLRTVFGTGRDDEPHQRVLPADTVRNAGAMWQEHDRTGDGATLRAACQEAVWRPFSLAAEPPLRVDLFRAGPDEHLLVLVLHHIAADGWSLGPLLRDLDTAYRARLGGAAPGWAPLPVQYADYTLWQHELLGDVTDPGGLLARQLAHWRDALDGLPEELPLPVDRPRPAVAGHRGDRVALPLDAELHAAIVRLAREHRVTLFMVLQASLAALLHRFGAGDDIPIGSVVAGRTDEALEELVGFFANTLVLRTDVSGDPSFAELLGRAREVNLSAQAHQDVPFERLVEELNPARSLARHPLFQVMLTLQNNDAVPLSLGGLEVTAESVDARGAKFDLSVMCEEVLGPDRTPAGIDVAVDYAVDLFDRETVARLTAAWARLLRQAVDAPGRSLSALEVLTPRERREALEQARGPVTVAAEAATLAERFAEQAARTPDALALDGALPLTYAELDARAGHLARRLSAAGARPGEPVALALAQSPHTVTAALALARTGAVCVPLDPTAAPEHRSAVLTAAGVRLLVTETPPPAPEPPGLRLVSPAAPAPLPDAPDAPDTRSTAPSAPAFLRFAPGPDGALEPVRVRHAEVTATAADTHWRPGDGPARTPFLAGRSFDAAGLPLWAPLLTGGTLVVLPEDRFAPDRLADTVAAHGLTRMWSAPDRLEQTARSHPAAFRGLETVLTAGDPVPVEPLVRIREACPELRLVCAHGPRVGAGAPPLTARVVTDGDLADGGPLPLGRPLDNLRVHVLDAGLRPVPAGVPGELCLAGPGRPQDPPAGPVVRTGARARRRPDGTLLPPAPGLTPGTVPLPGVTATAPRAPRTPQEETLHALFADTLGLDPAALTVDDDFFHLGGHSLLANRLAGRVRTGFGTEISLRTVFEHPTVAGLAAHLEAAGARAHDPLDVLLPLRAGGGQAPLFCVHPAAGISWVYSGLLRHLDPDRPLYGLQSRALRGEAAGSVEEMAADYVRRLRSVRPTGPYHLLGWSFGASVAHAMAVLLQEAGEEVALLALLDGYPAVPGSPARGELPDDPAEAFAVMLASLGYASARDPGFVELTQTLGTAAEHLPETFAGHHKLLDEHRPRRFTGEALFLGAAGDKPADWPYEELWRPYVGGPLTAHRLACAHGEMTRGASIAEIAALLTEHLGEPS
ncbi:amino acid adenylation domain-containing protein [Streptomyces taklimakanensis]|uniref:amino acid adenylation domain-containing protein n=1 Tax=Streptomyces taklimakanensis TaxID=2569853 RepID=UPI0012BAFC70